MVVGTSRLTLAIPESRSLKTKRKVLRSVLDRVRHRFNAAVAEVDAMDVHQRAVLGVAVVSNDARHAQSMLDKIISFVAETSAAQVTARSTEILHIKAEVPDAVSGEDWEMTPEDFLRGRRGDGA